MSLRPERWQLVDATSVRVLVQIRDNASGEVQEYYSNEYLEPEDEQPSDFGWSEGNYSCDCNRSLFFSRAKGEDEDWGRECSDGRFAVKLINPVTRQSYYNEFEDELDAEFVE